MTAIISVAATVHMLTSIGTAEGFGDVLYVKNATRAKVLATKMSSTASIMTMKCLSEAIPASAMASSATLSARM